jgi:ketosteroid isomerase-like protein
VEPAREKCGAGSTYVVHLSYGARFPVSRPTTGAGRRAYDPRDEATTDVVSFDVEPPPQHVGVEAKLKNWANVFAAFQDVGYEVRGLTVAVGDDVAFGHCFGRLHGTLINGTAIKGIWVRVTFCFRKLDGAWQIVHDQASVPFHVLSGRGVADLEP